MFKSVIVVLFLLMISASRVFSQDVGDSAVWHLRVIDSVTNKGIEKATLNINNEKHLIADVNGVIIVNKKWINPKAILNISCVGYKPVLLKQTENGPLPSIIKLSASMIDLQEVSVSALNSQIKFESEIKSYDYHRTLDPDDSFLQFIPNNNNVKGTIASIEYLMHDATQAIEKPFRVRLYSKSKGSIKPDRELLEDSLIVYNTEKKKIFSVDLLKYNIPLPEDGVIAVFETLDESFYGTDSVWYNDGRRRGYGLRGYLRKIPGVDMHITKKGFMADSQKLVDRADPFSMCGPSVSKVNLEERWYQWYVFTEGTTFGISITVRPDE